MIACVYRLTFAFSAVFTSVMLFSLCGCSQMNGFVMNESGQAYYKQGNYTMARKEFQKALLDDPTNPHYAYNLAAAAHKHGDHGTAEQYYQQALNLDPAHQPAYHGMASLMVDQGRTDEAQQLLTAWAGSQPYLAEPHIELAWLQRSMGDTAGAEQSLRQALQINPQHERAIAQLGQVFETDGRTEEALTMYQRSLYVNGNQPMVRSRMVALQDQIPAGNSGGYPAETTLAGMPAYGNTMPGTVQAAYTPSAGWNGAPMMSQAVMPQTMMPQTMMPQATMAIQDHGQMMEAAPMMANVPLEGGAVPMAGPARMMPASPVGGSFPQFDSGMTSGHIEHQPYLPLPGIERQEAGTPGMSYVPPAVPQMTQALPTIEAF